MGTQNTPVERFSRICITSGDPAGLGPDLIALHAHRLLDWQKSKNIVYIILINSQVLAQRLQHFGVDSQVFHFCHSLDSLKDNALNCLDLDCPAVTPGVQNQQLGEYCFKQLEAAVDMLKTQQVQGLLNLPINKLVMNGIDPSFTGHTNWLEEKLKAQETYMMMLGEKFKLLLLTCHIPLEEVPSRITRESLTASLRFITQEVKKIFSLEKPRFMLLGLNPHAGETGLIGRQEVEHFDQAIEDVQDVCEIIGPVSGDTCFKHPQFYAVDVVISPYHDQGLLLAKILEPNCVNFTLGLPYPRVSVNHGTAYSKVLSKDIDAGSFFASMESLSRMIQKNH